MNKIASELLKLAKDIISKEKSQEEKNIIDNEKKRIERDGKENGHDFDNWEEHNDFVGSILYSKCENCGVRVDVEWNAQRGIKTRDKEVYKSCKK